MSFLHLCEGVFVLKCIAHLYRCVVFLGCAVEAVQIAFTCFHGSVRLFFVYMHICWMHVVWQDVDMCICVCLCLVFSSKVVMVVYVRLRMFFLVMLKHPATLLGERIAFIVFAMTGGH